MRIISKRHKVFVSYHHKRDEKYRRMFENMCGKSFVSKSVNIGDINPNLKTETIRRKIRDEYLRDSTVTLVLVGRETWQRKHVDWEISSSIRNTQRNPRSGLLGIILPTHRDYKKTNYSPYRIPPRLYDNIKCRFAKIYNWSNYASTVQSWIHQAYLRKSKILPDISRPLFARNRSGVRWN